MQHASAIALLFAGVAVVGVAPIALVVIWLVRTRMLASDKGTEGSPRRHTLLLSFVLAAVLVASTGGGLYVLLAASPGTNAAAGHEDHELPAPGTLAGKGAALPERLAGLRRTQLTTGAEAIRETEQLHGKSLPLSDAAIARYAGRRIEIWISYPTEAAAASSMIAKMQERISRGESPFSPPRDAGDGVWATTGLGQEHFFYARDDAAWWVTADAELVDDVMPELLGAGWSGGQR